MSWILFLVYSKILSLQDKKILKLTLLPSDLISPTPKDNMKLSNLNLKSSKLRLPCLVSQMEQTKIWMDSWVCKTQTNSNKTTLVRVLKPNKHSKSLNLNQIPWVKKLNLKPQSRTRSKVWLKFFHKGKMRSKCFSSTKLTSKIIPRKNFSTNRKL